jgi:hypothetical protein
VGKIGKGRVFVGVSTPGDLAAIIDARAAALGWSRAQYALEIWTDWQRRGCPPVTEPDRLLQIAKAEKPARKVS